MKDRSTAPPRRSALPRMQLLAVTLGLALSALVPAQAQSLVQLYETARGYDAAYQSARLQYDATVAKAEQSRAGILPTVGLSATISRTAIDANIKLPSVAYGTQGATISASQPLYRPANQLTYEQGKKTLISGQAQLEIAEQDLIVRVSQAYFDVLAARDGVTFVEAQKAAVAEQLAAAKRNFEVGTSTITDTREA
ncbi:MAG: TolC family protein, partial [Burkholderiaceae bacterium]